MQSTNVNTDTQHGKEAESFIDRVLKARMTDLTPIKRLKPAVTVGGAIFARKGDFSVVTGQRKAGKTTVLQFVAATALMPVIPEYTDTLQIRAEYCQGKNVIYIDTEGSPEDTHDFEEGVKAIMGVSGPIPNFHTYHFRPFTQAECKNGVDVLFDLYPDTHLWIIDGIADLVAKPNDEEESNSTVRWVMSYASKYDTCIILVIHENPSKVGQDAKLRGHLGSELERKASGAIAVEKDRQKGEHYIRSRFLRKSQDFDLISFRFDPILKRPVSHLLSPEQIAAMNSRDYIKTKEEVALRDKCFSGSSQLSEKDLRIKIINNQGPSPSNDAARNKSNRHIQSMLKLNLIRKEKTADDVIYHLIDQQGGAIPFES